MVLSAVTEVWEKGDRTEMIVYMQSQQHLCGGHEAFTQWAVDQKRFETVASEYVTKVLDVTCFLFFFFSLGFFFFPLSQCGLNS